jgi:pyruvate ferredoxin oxidoreductase gamma subunit
VIEIRWHGRAGQGAKTASQLLAQALLATGRSVQAFPEYGPERAGAPVRAYTRVDDRPVRRRYGITEPDVVCVLDLSLLHEADATAGLREDGVLVLDAERAPDGLPGRVVCVPASKIAAQGAGYVNVVMLGALAAVLGEPPLEALLAAAAAKGIGGEPIVAGYRAVEELCPAA